MVQAKKKTLDFYIRKMEEKLHQRYPELTFRVSKWSDREATIYYSPYSEEEEFPIIWRISGIADDALVESGCQIYVIPDSEDHHDFRPPADDHPE